MPASRPITPATNRSRPPTRTGQTPAVPPIPTSATSTNPRVTRLRAAKGDAGSPVIPSKPSGLLARSKEGLRKVSEKVKEKEKEKAPEKRKPAAVESPMHTESLQAFLRIRPSPTDSSEGPSSRPYLEPQGDKEVLMRAPIDPSRPHASNKAPLIYSFDKVFPPSTSQSSFFTLTTLPLVEKLLLGENGLLFAYGVSNSGKSYTISGAGETNRIPSERGLLPRSIDVVFNSIKGLESQANLRCVGVADVELLGDVDVAYPMAHLPAELEGCTQEAVKVDRNYSYAVFVSYSEVYNEKIFDLLDAVLPSAHTSGSNPARRDTRIGSRSSAWGLPGAVNSSMNLAALANGGGGVIKRTALALKNDPEGSGKYISGLSEIRVRTREEALAVFRAGQRARQVFGTLANRESSRSHGIFTMKVVKIHNGAPRDMESAQVSRLAVVDLAGSERTRNTGTTGDRLKEAGNINKSLMVLGQCLEVLRQNQQKIAAPMPAGTRKKLAMVPFRHSKLTEIFQNFFVGDGRAVMIVNVNPYDTGFDENAHVMRFSAVAREVQTTASNKVAFPGQGLRRQISTQFSAFKQAVSGPMRVKVMVPVLPKEVPQSKGITERESQGFVMVEEELEVVEEDGESDSGDERDVMVDHLFEQLREERRRNHELEMITATIEADLREEMVKEFEDTVQRLQADFAKRLQEQVQAGELKMDRKIDILARTMTPAIDRRATIQQGPRIGDTYLRDTPPIDFDTSMESGTADQSFESALDNSLIESSISSISHGRPSDPFVVRRPANVNIVEEGDTSMDDSQMADISHDTIADTTIDSVDSAVTAETDDSEDVFAVDGDISIVPGGSDTSGLTENEQGDVAREEDEESDEQTESASGSETETASETEEEESAESGSDFEGSHRESARSTVSPSPPRRISIKRRGTLTPSKARVTPKKRASPIKQASVARASPIKSRAKVMSPPLGERLGQDDEDSEMEMPVKTKKKRTLGKKVALEDDIHGEEHVSGLGGAEVRRMSAKSVR